MVHQKTPALGRNSVCQVRFLAKVSDTRTIISHQFIEATTITWGPSGSLGTALMALTQKSVSEKKSDHNSDPN